jgi:hypothetical protein
MGDMGEIFNAYRYYKRERRLKFGVNCPKCAVVRPKAHPSILLPGQQCRVDGYRDPRAASFREWEAAQDQIENDEFGKASRRD